MSLTSTLSKRWGELGRPAPASVGSSADAGPAFAVIAAAWCVLFGIVVAPIWLVEWLPLADHTNHLSRAHIWRNLDTSEFLRRYYELVWRPQPNLSFDVFVIPLARVLPLDVAGKVFASLTCAVFTLAPLVLHRVVHKRYSIVPLAAFLIVMNRPFLWGFLGFMFGVGAAVLGIAGWEASRGWRTMSRLVLRTCIAIAVLLTHLFPFGIFAATVGLLELQRQVRWPLRLAMLRSLVVEMVPLLTCVVLMVALSPVSQRADAVAWGQVIRRIDAFAAVFVSYWPLAEVVLFGALLAAAAWLAWKGTLRLPRPFAITLVVLGTLQMVMPDKLFSSYAADRRLPVGIALIFLGVASVQINSRQLLRIVLPMLVAAVVIRSIGIFGRWQSAQPVFSDAAAVLESLPRGATLLPVTVSENPTGMSRKGIYEIGSLAVIMKDAYVPTTFAFPVNGAMSIAFTPDWLPPRGAWEMQKLTGEAFYQKVLPLLEGQVPLSGRLERLGPCFDYLLAVSETPWRDTVRASLPNAVIRDHALLMPAPKGRCRPGLANW